MSGSYYQLNQKYNQLLALIAAGGGGGGGSVSNPMTSNLNGGGYDIVNVDAVNAISFAGTTMTANRVSAADLLTATNFNETDAPYYNNLGAITNTGTGKYQIAQVPVAVDAECSTLCVLRALDSGLKHQVFFSIMAYEDKATIVVLNNVAESDTPVFGQITYGEYAVLYLFHSKCYLRVRCIPKSRTKWRCWFLRFYFPVRLWCCSSRPSFSVSRGSTHP